MADHDVERAASFARRPLSSIATLPLNSQIDPPARGIIVSAAGSYGLQMTDSTTATVYLAAGVVHPLVVKQITTAAGSVWGGE